jgi:GTP cyclohydrolase I
MYSSSSTLTSQEKQLAIAEKFTEILELLGLDLEDPSLQKTPQRIAKMYVQEIFSGLNSNSFPSLFFIEAPCSEQMIFVKNIPIHSMCEHHFLPMVGHAHIAYCPQKHILGLSKIHRIAQHFAKKPQLQERLTREIANSLSSILRTEDIAVCMELKHFCVLMRGVQDIDSTTRTCLLKGQFLHSKKQEFLCQI